MATPNPSPIERIASHRWEYIARQPIKAKKPKARPKGWEHCTADRAAAKRLGYDI